MGKTGVARLAVATGAIAGCKAANAAVAVNGSSRRVIRFDPSRNLTFPVAARVRVPSVQVPATRPFESVVATRVPWRMPSSAKRLRGWEPSTQTGARVDSYS